MGEAIVTFQDKKDAEFVTPPMQVPLDFSAQDMERFLNTLLNEDKAYAFFYKGEQITKIPEAESEETLNIEFISVTKITASSASIDVQSKITCISIRRNEEIHTDTVVVCTVEGETKEFSLSPGMDAVKAFSSFHPIRAVTSTGSGIFILTTTNKVVDVSSSEVVFESEMPIRTIGYSGGLLAIGLASKDIVVIRDRKEEKRLRTEDEIGKIIVREIENKIVLIAGLVPGAVEVFDTETWKSHKISLKRPITAMGYEDGRIYAGGLGGIVTVCSLEKVEEEYQSDVDFISRIECGTVFFGYTNKNKVFIRDKKSFIGTHLLELAENVTDMKISGKRLFVAEGSFLKIFNIFDD